MADTSSRFRPDLSRRDALGAITGAAACTIVPGLARGSPPFYRTVAAQARALAQGRQIELRLLLPDGSQANLKPVIQEFTKLTGIQVALSLTHVDNINSDLSLDALSQTNSFDLALPATFGIPDLAAAGILRPLTDFSATYEPADFRDQFLYPTGDSFDGDTYGFQADGDTYLMFYNKEMLENADTRKRYADRYGTPLAIPQSWSELDQQMAFFHRPDAQQYGGLLFRTKGYVAWEWWVRLHAKGSWPFSEDMEPLIASDAGVEALEEMIAATASLYPGAERFGLFENWERFAEGSTYCNIGWGGTQKFLNQPGGRMRGNLRHGPTPGGVVAGVSYVTPYFNWGWNYVVVKTARHAEIAYLFALFASSAEMSTRAVRQPEGFFDPHRAEHYEDPVIRETYTPAFLDVHRASLRDAIPNLYLKDQGAYFWALGQGISQALRGEASAKNVLERVTRQWYLITSNAGKPHQIERWKRLRAKYPAALRAVLDQSS